MPDLRGVVTAPPPAVAGVSPDARPQTVLGQLKAVAREFWAGYWSAPTSC